jgi:hypothetical protein
VKLVSAVNVPPASWLTSATALGPCTAISAVASLTSSISHRPCVCSRNQARSFAVFDAFTITKNSVSERL